MSGRREALTPESCDHQLVDAWVIDDGQSDAGKVVAWACRFCRRKFAPKAAAAREALPSVEEMAQAMHDVIAPLDGHVHDDSCDPALTVDTSLATALLDHIRAARASDGGR